MTEPYKCQCSQCDKHLMTDELLTHPNPFDLDDVIYGCPNCKSIDCFEKICDEDGCEDVASGGHPTSSGYRITCFVHTPK